MRHLLDFACDGSECDRPLSADELRLTFASGETIRRVYECPCGAVTVTVGRATA